MPSIEQKIQSYLNFSKSRELKAEETKATETKAEEVYSSIGDDSTKKKSSKKVSFAETQGCKDAKKEIKRLKSESDSDWEQMNDLKRKHNDCLSQAKKVDGRYYPKGDTTQTPCHIYDEVAKTKMLESFDNALEATRLEGQYNKFCK